jgi:hypothetical protein
MIRSTMLVALLLVVLLAHAPGSAAGGTPLVARATAGYRLVDPQTHADVGANTFDEIRPFVGGFAAVRRSGSWGYVNEAGVLAIPPIYHQAGDFSEGLAAVQSGGMYGYIDTSGKVTLIPAFERAKAFSQGVAPVRVNGMWHFIDRQGRAVSVDQFDIAENFSNGLAAIRRNGKWGYVDRSLSVVIAAQFDAAGAFSESVAPVAVRQNGSLLYGYISRAGSYVIPPQFRAALPFAEGLGPVEVGQRWAYIDHGGAIKIKPRYVQASPFQHGLALVVDGTFGRTQYIDSGGHVAFVRSETPEGSVGTLVLVPLSIDSQPEGIRTYLVPQLEVSDDPLLLHDKARLEPFRVKESDVTPIKTNVYEQIYFVVYEWHGALQAKRVDIIAGKTALVTFTPR